MTDPEQTAAQRPLRADAERNRKRILRAAAEVFTTRGLQASLDDVARQAGVGVGTVYRRFPDKEALAEALFEERIDAMVELARKALANPDSWDGLVTFLTEAGTLLAHDRGLREILMWATYGRDRVERGKAKMQPVVTAIVERAQRDGKLRADLAPTDFPFIELMLSAAAEYASDINPGVWLRYLTLIIDGMRPARDDVTPFPVPALEPEEMLRVMRGLPQQMPLVPADLPPARVSRPARRSP